MHRVRWRLLYSLLGALLAVGAASACSSTPERVSLTVTPTQSASDEAITVRLSGAHPGSAITLRMASRDANNLAWASAATFRTDAHGRVDTSTQAPTSGSYTNVSAAGLVWSMQPDPPGDAVRTYYWGSAPSFLVSAWRGPKRLASLEFTRPFNPSGHTVSEQDLSPTSGGVFGAYLTPDTAGRHPAVLLFGGSEGGLRTTGLASLLAGHGIPTMAVAYFKEPGLPQNLSAIPLENFGKALQWLARQPEVDPHRIIVWGVSRGSEAALLLGVHNPTLVHAVIAGVPSNVSRCGFPHCRGSAWTWRGRPVPFTRRISPTPLDDPAAVIPVEQIDGTIVTYCGGEDQVWNSCSYASTITLRRHNPHDLAFAYDAASHAVGAPFPYTPTFDPQDAVGQGALDQLARAELWPHLLQFLADQSEQPGGYVPG